MLDDSERDCPCNEPIVRMGGGDGFGEREKGVTNGRIVLVEGLEIRD